MNRLSHVKQAFFDQNDTQQLPSSFSLLQAQHTFVLLVSKRNSAKSQKQMNEFWFLQVAESGIPLENILMHIKDIDSNLQTKNGITLSLSLWLATV